MSVCCLRIDDLAVLLINSICRTTAAQHYESSSRPARHVLDQTQHTPSSSVFPTASLWTKSQAFNHEFDENPFQGGAAHARAVARPHLSQATAAGPSQQTCCAAFGLNLDHLQEACPTTYKLRSARKSAAKGEPGISHAS